MSDESHDPYRPCGASVTVTRTVTGPRFNVYEVVAPCSRCGRVLNRRVVGSARTLNHLLRDGRFHCRYQCAPKNRPGDHPMLLYLAGPMTGRIVEKNMSYTVWKEFRFEAAHSLPHLPVGHKCRNKHGHSYRVVVYCTGEPDERGFVVDYAELAAAMEPVLAKLDHRDIDEIIKPSTCENLAKWIWERMDAHEWGHRKPDGVVWVPSLRIRVLVQETPMSGVEYQQ